MVIRIIGLLVICFFLQGFTPVKPINTKVGGSTLDTALEASLGVRDPKVRQDLQVEIAEHFSAQGEFEKAESVVSYLDTQTAGASRMRILTSIVLAKAHAGDVDAAIAYALRLQRAQERDYALEQLTLYLLELDQAESANRSASYISGSIIQARTQRKVAEYYISKADIDNAFTTALRIQNVIEKELAFASLSVYYASLGDLDKVQELFALIQSDDLLEKAYADVALELTKQHVLPPAFELVNGIQDNNLFYQTLSQMVKELAAIKKFESAFKVAEQLNNEFYYNQSLVFLSGALADNGQSDNALAIAELITSEVKQQEAYELIVTGFSKNFFFDSTFEVIELLKSQEARDRATVTAAGYFGSQPDHFYPSLLINQIEDDSLRSHSLIAFAVSFSQFATPKKIIQILSDVSDKTLLADTYFQLAESYGSRGQFVEADLFVKAIYKRDTLAKTLMVLSEASVSRNMTLQAQHYIKRFADVTKDLSYIQLKAEYLMRLGALYNTMGEHSKAKSATSKSLSLLSKVSEISFRETLQLAAIDNYFAAGDYMKAFRVIKKLPTVELQTESLLKVTYPEDPKLQSRYKSHQTSILNGVKRKL